MVEAGWPIAERVVDCKYLALNRVAGIGGGGP